MRALEQVSMIVIDEKSANCQSGNTYEIYKQDILEIDMHSHLLRWLEFYELKLGRKLEPEDHIFPHISANGQIHTHKEMSYDMLSKLLTEFAGAAGVEVWLTTHSFRRGSAKYRFYLAPPSQCWLLNVVRWWGGWAEGENVREIKEIRKNCTHVTAG